MRPLRGTRRPSPPDADLTICRRCGSDTVNPTEWTERGQSSWWMHLRCGSCGTSREVVVADAAAARYDADLDRGTRAIAAALRRLEHKLMAEEADAFATALRLDLLDAGDFAG